MTKARELRDLSEDELKDKVIALYQELYKLNQQRYAGRVDKPHLFRKTVKDIARIKTILKENKSNEKKKS